MSLNYLSILLILLSWRVLANRHAHTHTHKLWVSHVFSSSFSFLCFILNTQAQIRDLVFSYQILRYVEGWRISFFFPFFIRYLAHLHFQCYTKSPPYPPTPPFWPWRSPVLGHTKFTCPMGLSFQWWPIRPSFVTYAARVKRSGVLVSS